MNEIEKQFNNTLETYLKESNQIEVQSKTGEKLYRIITKKNLKCGDLENFHMTIKDCKWGMADKEIAISVVTDQNPLYAINGYIPDFIMIADSSIFAIEIDGHEWHEKTKEQAAADKQRERVLLKHNIIPIRFTGSEVYHSAVNCIKEILEIIASFEYNRIFEEFRKNEGANK